MNDGGVADELVEAGRYMVRHELAWGNAGNISASCPVRPSRRSSTRRGTGPQEWPA